MKWDERVIVTAISRQVFQRKCLLLVNNCSWTGAECDVLCVTHDLRIIDVEVKITRADLKADAKKHKWWHVPTYTEAKAAGLLKPNEMWDPWVHAMPTKWPRRVWKHYYAMPEEIWKPDLLSALPSPVSGVILLREGQPPWSVAVARVERRATPNKDAYKLTPEQVLDIARLSNLRLWDAYEAIERLKNDRRELNEQIAA